jgi:hypothetical protein
MKLLIAFVLLVSAGLASAQSRIVSIDAFDLSYTGGILLKSDNAKGSDPEETTFKINLNYAQNWEQYVGLMWKARAFINRTEIDQGKADTLDSSWGVAGGFLYNFQHDNIKESIFAGILVGFERMSLESQGKDDESGFNLFTDLEAGKRFDLGQYSAANISYAPSVALNLKRYGGGIRDEYYKNGHELKINFLKFDILF